MTQLERHKDNELAHYDSDEIAVSFHWNRRTGDLNVVVDGDLDLSVAVEAMPEQSPTAPPLHTPAHPVFPDTRRRSITVTRTRPFRPAPVLGGGPLPGTRERVQRILDAAPPIALLQRLAHKTVRRVRYTNDDGTPTQWWAVVNIYAPAIVVISIVVAAILK